MTSAPRSVRLRDEGRATGRAGRVIATLMPEQRARLEPRRGVAQFDDTADDGCRRRRESFGRGALRDRAEVRDHDPLTAGRPPLDRRGGLVGVAARFDQAGAWCRSSAATPISNTIVSAPIVEARRIGGDVAFLPCRSARRRSRLPPGG